MAQDFGSPAHLGGNVNVDRMAASHDLMGHSQRKGWRGLIALGFLFLTATVSYGLVFVLIDKWYKGGTLGIL